MPRNFPNLLADFWMPQQRASTYGGDVDFLFYLILGISIFFFLLITSLLVFFVIKYRQRDRHAKASGPTHSTALELTWTIIPVIIVLVIFYIGFKGFLRMSVLPANVKAYEIQVTGKAWSWSFTYPNGTMDNELYVPKDVPIRLVTDSVDVIHSLYIPAFRFKRDVVPGRYNKWWFQADKLGDYDIYCAAYCGTQHSTMLSKVHVMNLDAYRKWLENASKWETRMTPLEAGKNFYVKKGCAQCHSTDGTRIIGPSFKDLFNSKVALTDRSIITADEAYIRESILEPGKKIVAGFDNVMPTSQGRIKDSEIGAIIAYMKSISANYKETTLPVAKQPATQPTTQPK